MNYYDEIKNKLIDNEVYERVKDYSKERHRVITYYEIGKLLSEAGKHYGEGIIKEYSEKLTRELGKKYSYRTLNYMLKLYKFQKMQSVTANLSWGHWIELLNIKEVNKVLYYINQVINQSLTTRELRFRIKNNEYERIPLTSEKRDPSNDIKIVDSIRNPILIKNSFDKIVTSEKMLQRSILENIPLFLNELGNGYCFISNEYRIRIGDTYNYIDLLLYNIEYNCYVVIELKVTELKKEHIGQIQVYMNYIDNNLRKYYQDKTIGIIICKKGNKYIIEYSSDPRIIAREYELV